MDKVRGGHEQRWAVAVACFHDARKGRKVREVWETFDDPDLLWGAVATWCGASGRTVLWTHNLGYDSRIADVFSILPARGWTLVAHNLTPRGMWLVWIKGRATLCMVDSASVLPTTLAAIGKTVRMGKRPLPRPGSGGVGLFSRCWQDVAILREAITQYLTWLEAEDLGNWQMTGAGQAWATYRHRFLHSGLVIHDDAEALAAERRAMWTGRCEAFWRGEIGYQVVHEWDFSLAYGRIASTVDVPVRLVGPLPDDADALAYLGSRTTGVLADVTVTTGMPVVPASVDGGVAWPVGTFTTTLWDVEIQAAIDAGATVTVHRGWLYRKAPALREWAQWLIGVAQSQTGDDGDWRYFVSRHQLRALIGRLAMTHTDWEEWADSPTPNVLSCPVYDADTGETYRTVHIGHQVWRDRGQKEWEHSMPMVTGYVQAVGRVWLWHLLSEMPPGAALYCDTDGVLATDQFLPDLQEIADRHPEWGLRLKRSWQGFAVWGPRQIRTGPQVRVSGLPRDATRIDRHRFTGEIWESVSASLVTGNTDRVRTRDRTWQIRGVDRRRDGPGVGWTRPIRIGGTDDDGQGRGNRQDRPEAPGNHAEGAVGAPPAGRCDDREGRVREDRERCMGTAPGVSGPAAPERSGDGRGCGEAAEGARRRVGRELIGSRKG